MRTFRDKLCAVSASAFVESDIAFILMIDYEKLGKANVATAALSATLGASEEQFQQKRQKVNLSCGRVSNNYVQDISGCCPNRQMLDTCIHTTN